MFKKEIDNKIKECLNAVEDFVEDYGDLIIAAAKRIDVGIGIRRCIKWRYARKE